jgi:bifunctional non-homologous end joining protein LigD
MPSTRRWSRRSALGSQPARLSVPIGWDELQDPELRPDRWTIRTVMGQVSTVGDPLAPLIGREQELPAL